MQKFNPISRHPGFPNKTIEFFKREDLMGETYMEALSLLEPLTQVGLMIVETSRIFATNIFWGAVFPAK